MIWIVKAFFFFFFFFSIICLNIDSNKPKIEHIIQKYSIVYFILFNEIDFDNGSASLHSKRMHPLNGHSTYSMSFIDSV